MVPFVFLLGILATLLGAVAIAFGVPINEFGLGNTLIVAGTTTASAGLVVIALGAILRAIERGMGASATLAEEEPTEPSAERSDDASEWPRPAPIPPLRAEAPHPEHAETPSASRPPWSGAREEAGREAARGPAARTVPPPLRQERGPPPPARASGRAERPREPTLAPPQPGSGLDRAPEPFGADEANSAHAPEPPAEAAPAAPERRRLFAWTRRSGAGREGAEPPAEPRTARRADMEDREAIRKMARSSPERSPPAHQAHPGPEHQVEVLKSGTVGGMSYTLYTDGSIDAEFPDGKLRFDSIEDLRRHLEEQGS